MIKTKLEEAQDILRRRKIEFEGSSFNRNEDYYYVAGVKITVKTTKVGSLNPIRLRKYWCTCKYHSVKDVDRDKFCSYVLALAIKLNDKRTIKESNELEDKNEKHKISRCIN